MLKCNVRLPDGVVVSMEPMVRALREYNKNNYSRWYKIVVFDDESCFLESPSGERVFNAEDFRDMTKKLLGEIT